MHRAAALLTHWVRRAKDILEQSGAQDIASADEKSGDFANREKPMPRTRTAGSGGPMAEEVLDGDPIVDRPLVHRRSVDDPETV